MTWTNESAIYTSQIDPAQPLTITWTGGDANGYVDIQGSAQNAAGTWYVGFECAAPTSAQQFTIPPAILLAMPAGATTMGSIQVSTYAIPTSLGAVPGFDVAVNQSKFQASAPVVFK